jgi:hypothetical protein
MTKHKAGVPHFGWTLLADAIAKLSNASGITKQEAARQVITAARDGALYTRGRLHHAKGYSFAISPAAWEGMDPDPVMSRLCPPNPDLEVQEPFLGAPVVHEVEIHNGSLEAWKAGDTRPPTPIMQPITMPSALRHSALVWRELHFAADTKMAATEKAKPNKAKPNKADNVKAILRELHPDGVIPAWRATKLLLKRVNDTLEAGKLLPVSDDTLRRAVSAMEEEHAATR